MKLYLINENKIERVRCTLRFVRHENNTFPFFDMKDHVHIGEKWIYLKTANKNVYLTEYESAPPRSGKSKRFIPKFMRLAAVDRPRSDYKNKKMFDGKLGIWAIVHNEPAKKVYAIVQLVH